jgi:hypothetical protein
MSLVPEAARVTAAGFLGTIFSFVLLEVGLRTKSRRVWAVVVGCIVVVLAWEGFCWSSYAVYVRSAYLAAQYRLAGPSEWYVFWMQTESYLLIALIPALVLRSVVSRRSQLGVNQRRTLLTPPES